MPSTETDATSWARKALAPQEWSTAIQLPIDSLTLQTVVCAIESGSADGLGLDEEIDRDLEH